MCQCADVPINCQLSTVNYQLSIINCCLAAWLPETDDRDSRAAGFELFVGGRFHLLLGAEVVAGYLAKDAVTFAVKDAHLSHRKQDRVIDVALQKRKGFVHTLAAEIERKPEPIVLCLQVGKIAGESTS